MSNVADFAANAQGMVFWVSKLTDFQRTNQNSHELYTTAYRRGQNLVWPSHGEAEGGRSNQLAPIAV
jgi:hypothetical protein